MKGFDFNDLAQQQGPEAVSRALLAAAPPEPAPEDAPASPTDPATAAPPELDPTEAEPAEDEARTIAALSRLNVLEYDRARAPTAKRLGVSVTALDQAVKLARKDTAADNLPGKPLHFDIPEPWPERVEGAALLAELDATLRRFCILDPASYIAAALWIVFTHAVEHAHTAPILYLTSPEPRCGKSTLLNLLGQVVAKPLPAANVTPSALFRTIEAASPTILLDEADAGLNDNEDLRGLLNSGHTRVSAFVIRVEGDSREPRKFSTWGCRAIAGIGKGAQTIMDRSITILLRRKLTAERVERLRHAPAGHFGRLKRQIVRFVADHAHALRNARPELPEALNDRAQDNWEPLLAIADLAGGDWPQKARDAALALAGSVEETKSLRVEILEDIRAVFRRIGRDRISTDTLLEHLTSDPERPWATYNRGKPMTAKNLAGFLGHFGIKSKDIRVPEKPGPVKGYFRAVFEDAFARYLPAAAPAPAPASAAKPSAAGPLHPGRRADPVDPDDCETF